MSKLIAKEYKRFEDIKIAREDGSEYCSARELVITQRGQENIKKCLKAELRI